MMLDEHRGGLWDPNREMVLVGGSTIKGTDGCVAETKSNL